MAQPEALRVAVSGGAGQVGYPALFRIANGDMFGFDQPVKLQLLEQESAMKQLEAAAMELEDCAFPLLRGIEVTANPDVAFDRVSWAILLGAARRERGMERSDLLQLNSQIFQHHGKSLAANADDSLRTVVVGNPCNTNSLIARENAREVPSDRWFAMMRLDENRARSHLAQRAGVPVTDVSRVVVWGNHSSTQYPDGENALIQGKPAASLIQDDNWLQGEFVKSVQQRGAAIIEARGTSSAASASYAVVDTVRAIRGSTNNAEIHSLAVMSHGEYGVPEGLQFGFPVLGDSGTCRVMTDLEIGEFGRHMIDATAQELLQEKAIVADYLP